MTFVKQHYCKKCNYLYPGIDMCRRCGNEEIKVCKLEYTEHWTDSWFTPPTKTITILSVDGVPLVPSIKVVEVAQLYD